MNNAETEGCVIADSVNLDKAKRRAHEHKLHIANKRGHMPFQEDMAYLLDEIIRLENLVFAQQKNLDSGMWEREYRIEHGRVEHLTAQVIDLQNRLSASIGRQA